MRRLGQPVRLASGSILEVPSPYGTGYSLSKRNHRESRELEQLVRLRGKHGELMQGVFMLILRAGIDAVHGNDDAVTMNTSRSRCRVEDG